MAIGWTADIATVGAAHTDYGEPIESWFVKRLNGLGYFAYFLPDLGSNPIPTKGQVTRLTWDKGGASQRTHFEGVIEDVRQVGQLNVVRVTGFDLLGLLWKSAIGPFRDYFALTPHAIIQQSPGPPLGLLYNSQGTLVMNYGASASVPFKVDGANPGTALDAFRSDSNRNLINIQRLALQHRYDGASYGLEFFAQLEGANLSTPTFYLVKRRNRAAAYTPESFNVPNDFVLARRGFEGTTAADAVRVVGAGDGQTRVESSIIGAGGLEGIMADKTILDAVGATNMANRLSTLLNPATEVVNAQLAQHGFSTEVGDDVTVTQTGKPDYTGRVFEMGYSLVARSFFLNVGRPKSFKDTLWHRFEQVSGGQAFGPQRVGAGAVSALPASGNFAALANNATVNLALSFATRTYRPLYDEALQLFVQFSLTVGAGDVDLEVDVPNGGTFMYRGRHTAPGTAVFDLPLYLTSQLLLDNGITGAITSARLRLTNRTGANIDGTLTLSGHVVG